MDSKQLNLSYHTSFIFICKEGFGKGTVEELLGNYEAIKGEVEIRYKDIVFLTIYPIKKKKRKFESSKLKIIGQLRGIADYLSILYDSQTAFYMQQISKSVYNLEREFRALIEIVFLKNKGKSWYNKYFEDSKKEQDRAEKRPDCIKLIDNPLDKRNFVDLRTFVSQNINSSKNTILQKLQRIEEKLDSYLDLADFEGQELKEISVLLSDIKESSDLNRQSVSINDLYEHLTPTLSQEWQELYDQRNLWAHNYCLFTKEEFSRYTILSSTVLRKVRTEVTLLSLFNDEESQSFIVGNHSVNINLHKVKSEGSSICKLKIKFNLGSDKSYLYEVPKATYVDLIDISKILAEFIDDTSSSILLNNIEANPFLTGIIKSTVEKIINSSEMTEKIAENFEQLQKLLDKEYFLKVKMEGINFKKGELNKVETKMNDDLNNLLQQVFQPTESL
ncbi:hypothetical protein BMEGG_00698 [Priestia megaterium]|uniref:hypothetical protein n=1 Tax=Priestia megaterium TaxID=1404 RepID=UPI0030CB9A43